MEELKYNYDLDLENKESTHTKILDLVEKGSCVLELGCASGYMTRYMKEQLNCRVACVEIDEKAAAVARPFCEDLVVGDVETLDFEKAGLKDKYDVILMIDILEHLKNADQLLVTLRQYLAPHGYILISIPNGTHASVALEFLDGKAEYRETGLLDTTHLKFFDKDSFIQMMDKAGFLISHLDRVIVHSQDTELEIPWVKYPRQVTAYIEKVNTEFQTYQFIIKAFPTTEKGWKKGLEDAVRSQKQIRSDIERKLISNQKDLDWHKTEVQRLNRELKDKEDKYSRILAAEKYRLAAEIESLLKGHGQIKVEFGKGRVVYEQSIHSLENEMKQVHAGYRTEIDRQQNEIFKFTSAYETKKNDCINLENYIQQIEDHTREIEQQLALIHHSLAWRLLQKYRSILDRLLPENTKRKRFYQLAVLAPVVLLKEGPRSFADKIIRRLPGVKFSNNLIHNDIEFVSYQDVKISVVIPVFNKVEYTYKCLKSILQVSESKLPYEVIVVDNASSDGTPGFLKKIKGVNAIFNKENKGFVEACNMGAAQARGQFVLFLNNDTQVTAQWLDKMLAPFKTDEKVGITGAKLVYPDGTLQEAGGIIFQDATGWNYGKGQDPEQPEFSYRKEVDYCSGACLMIRKTLWDEIGGFDMRYAPAYYEDTDLCFTARKMGYKVIYQPEARIIHYEGVSAGTDINKGFKRYQQENHEKFLDKWEQVLKNDHHKGSEQLFYARQRSCGKTILVADHYAPTFDKDSGPLRMFSILKLLVQSGHRVIFWPENRARDEYTNHLQRIGVEALYGDIRFDDYIRENGEFFDLIIFSRPHVAVNMIYSAKTFSNARIVYDTVDLHFLREERKALNDPDSNSEYWKQIEFFLSDMADEVWVVSDVEKQILEDHGYNEKVSVVTNVHENMGCTKPFKERNGLLFIGGFLHTPNEDAMVWFVEKIFPKIEQAIAGITLTIVGSHPSDAVRALADQNVKVTGYIEDVTSYFENSRVFVSPLRYGAGVKGKIGQSLSFGLPVVTTPIGAEGMGLVDGETMLLAEDEDLFAQKVVELYHDEQVWSHLSGNGMKLIEKRFSPEVIQQSLDNLIGKLT
ncbi:MAG: glycosyltransferase [Bacteroidetes bacterium]|nr:glycosyltransferase [Bacteroidota bacterium]